MRIVLDTNAVISALFWGGPPRRIMDIARHGDTLRLYTSTTLLAELADVLSRDKFIPYLAAHNLTPAAIMQRYGVLTMTLTPPVIARTVPRDADDDAVIACAIAACADMIVTGDRHLLELHPFRNIAILTPADALQRLTAGA
ncbi:MAG: putative toxin-antitoxin system toxin component, PIN family [Pseudomonadota bacterium]